MPISTSTSPIIYGQVVCGPPGSGKTTFCNGMQQYLTLLGRNVGVVNLDPANEMIDNSQQYKCLLNVCTDIVNLQNVMEELHLGPNGGLLYCMEYIEAHADDLVALLQARLAQGGPYYLLFDLPGQVEVYTHGKCVANLMKILQNELNLRLTCVPLVDATSCWEANKFLSAALLSTTTMLRMELPTVSVLSKVDLLAQRDQDMPFSLEYFLECHDLDRLVEYLDGHNNIQGSARDDYESNYMDDPDYVRARQKTRQSKYFKKHSKLHQLLSEVINDFGLLSFVPLDISKADSVGRVVSQIDKANGFVFLSDGTSNQVAVGQNDLFQVAMLSESAGASHYEAIADIRERLE